MGIIIMLRRMIILLSSMIIMFSGMIIMFSSMIILLSWMIIMWSGMNIMLRSMIILWRGIIIKGLVAGCHSFCLFFIFYNIHSFIHSITFIQYSYLSPFAEASLHFLIACLLSGETPPCGAEARIELRPALQQADALPTEPRRTMVRRGIIIMWNGMNIMLSIMIIMLSGMITMLGSSWQLCK